jgi:hypothetical protein
MLQIEKDMKFLSRRYKMKPYSKRKASKITFKEHRKHRELPKKQIKEMPKP